MKKSDTRIIIKAVVIATAIIVAVQVIGLWLLAGYVSQTAAGIHEGIHTLRTESQ